MKCSQNRGFSYAYLHESLLLNPSFVNKVLFLGTKKNKLLYKVCFFYIEYFSSYFLELIQSLAFTKAANQGET